ncbi:RDD family protein [Neptunicella marina]|uniref:RDD family protein n=1 Tax=Neptunicella marina TaxID=2125989 RepID=A0A8J6ISB4_9ALTE|nr:RDD family protein [Neptunicella marina]MBC3765499.1 RDD family protein [Neptunicella marina]
MTDSQTNYPRAGIFRRLAAMVYDTLVAVAVAMCAAMVMILPMVIMLNNGVIDMQGYAFPSDFIGHSMWARALIQIWVILWVAGFFLWFWKHGGQTLGMRAWRLRILSTNEQPLTYPRLMLRMISSLLGAGTLLAIIDFKSKLSLQDRIAKTEVVSLTKEQNHHRSWKGYSA